MRERWVIDRRNGKVVPAENYVPPERERAPIVIKDYEPYKSMADGSIISGRAHHREHLRRHNCFEIGNERVKRVEKPLPAVSHEEVKRAIWQLKNER